MRQLFVVLTGLFCALAHASGPAVLNNTDHAVQDATGAIAILGGTNTVNQTCPTGTTAPTDCFTAGGPQYLVESTAIANAVNSGVAEYLALSSTSTGTPNTNVPYKVINQSSTGYVVELDQNNYSALVANDQIYVMAYCGGPGSGDLYPPIAFSTILPNTLGALTSNDCGYASGIEFSMTSSYMGFDTSSPSGTTESLSAVVAVLRANHSTWGWGDVKGALRQTASNWSTGYTAYNATGPAYGFGNIDYTSANAISSTASIYLQGPGLTVSPQTGYAVLTLYPFKTTRRSKEAIYSVSSSYSWPVKNEYTTSDITASGATLLYTSNGTDVTPTYVYTPAASGSVTFIAFTTDGSGAYSRAESYSEQTISLTLNGKCYNN